MLILIKFMDRIKVLLKSCIFLLAYIFHRNHDSKVIYYHDVSKKYTDMGTELELMKRHFKLVRVSGYSFVPSVNQPKGQVMVCFDDGWRGLYDYKDFFVQERILPTVFIAVSLIGEEGYLSIEQIKELEELGFRFECHAWSHYDLSTYSERDLEHELKDSKEWLEKTFGHPFNDICYPQGRFSDTVHKLCNRYGYVRQFSSISGGYYDLNEQGLVCRNCAQFSSPSEFKWMLNSTSTFYKKRLMKQHYQQ